MHIILNHKIHILGRTPIDEKDILEHMKEVVINGEVIDEIRTEVNGLVNVSRIYRHNIYGNFIFAFGDNGYIVNFFPTRKYKFNRGGK